MRSTAFEKQREVNDILARIDSAWVSTHALAKPTVAAFSIGTACDLKCVFCSRQHFLPVDSGFMDLERFKHLAPSLIGTRKATLFGLGDPLLNRQFMEYVKLCHAYGIEASTTTHAMHLSEEIARALVEEGMEEVAISLDAAEQGLLQQLRENSDLERIKANVRRLAEIKKAAGAKYPVLILTCTTSNLNLEQMPALVELGAELACEVVCFANMIAIKPEFVRYTITDDSALKRHLEEAKSLGECLGVTVAHFSPKMQPWQYVPLAWEGAPHGCAMAWEGLFVERQGETRPCCYTSIGQASAFENDLPQLMDSEDKMALRRDLIEGRVWVECRGCNALEPNSRQRAMGILDEAERQIESAQVLEHEERLRLGAIVHDYRRRCDEQFPIPNGHAPAPLHRRIARRILPRPIRAAAQRAIKRVY